MCLLQGRSRSRFRRMRNMDGDGLVDTWRFSFPLDPQRERFNATIGIANNLIEDTLGAVTLSFSNSPGPDGRDCLPSRDSSRESEHRCGSRENSLTLCLLACVIEAAHEFGDRLIAR